MDAPRYRRLFAFFSRDARRRAQDIDDEIAVHLEMRVASLVARGVSREDAEAEARRRFGDIDGTRRALRRIASRGDARMRLTESLREWTSDLRYTLRVLRRDPAFTVMVVITLAFGIGANATMFGIVDRLLLRGPSHVVEPDRLQRVYITEEVPGQGAFTSAGVGYVVYDVLRQHPRTVQSLGGYAVNDATTGRGQEAEKIAAGYATSSLFPTLGVAAQRGRFFGADEDEPDHPQQVAVVGDAFWKRHFRGAADVIGRTLTINEQPYTIIGIAPPGFTGAELTPVDVWLPMSILGARVTDDWTRSWDAQWMRVVVRLAPGATAADAGRELTPMLRHAYTGSDPGMNHARVSLAPLHYQDDATEPAVVAVSRWLLGVAAVLLLIACINVANLMIVRVIGRRREMAVRLALGISRGRLIRLMLTEGLALAVAGALGGMVIAAWAGDLVRGLLSRDVEWDTHVADPRVLAITTIAALVATLLIGVVPALEAGRGDIAAELKAGVREGFGRRARLRTVLTVAQSALSVLLLVGAGLFVRSLWQVRALDMGLQSDRVLTADVEWPSMRSFADADRASERARRDSYYDRALEQLERRPEVEHAAIAIGTPFHTRFQLDLSVPGWDSLPQMPGGGPYVQAVSSDYFATVGTRLLAGRVFSTGEGATTERVMVVGATMAHMLWPRGDAIGGCVKVRNGPCARVVGIVEDTRHYALTEKPSMQYYIPLGQEAGIGGRMLLVRPRGNAEAYTETLRRELQAIRPDLGYIDIQSLQDALDPQVRSWRLGAAMFGLFGALALLVAAIGLYSLIAYGVTQRRHELGVRLALGARPWRLVALIMQQGVRASAVGIGFGLVLAAMAGKWIAPLLFETSPYDVTVFAAVAAVLMVAALLATLVPARRATRTDPAMALRSE